MREWSVNRRGYEGVVCKGAWDKGVVCNGVWLRGSGL